MFSVGNQRKAYTPEYKDEAVRLAISTGRPVATVARELGIVEQTLGNWVKAYKVQHEADAGALSETERSMATHVG
nr:transposase [Microbacterium saperdae]